VWTRHLASQPHGKVKGGLHVRGHFRLGRLLKPNEPKTGLSFIAFSICA
jgi:hypothetical protein